MSEIIRGTTPTVTINTDTDLTGYDTVLLTLEDKDGNEVTADKTQMTITATAITAILTQEQTLALEKGRIKLQIRAKVGTSAIASDIMTGTLGDVLKDGVI